MRKRFLYRICTSTSKLVMAGLVAFLVAGAVLHVAAQGRQRKRPDGETQQNEKYPEIPGKTIKKARALAVMVWTGDEKNINNARLVPLCVYYENQFNDANTYFAEPYPLALEGGTVYEVESHGERQGYFTVGQLQRYRGDWFGLGQFKTMAEVTPTHRSHKKDTQHTPDDDRPVMKRRAGSGSGNDGSGSSGSKEQIKAEEDNPELAAEMSDDSDRPTLKRQPATGSGSTGSGSGSASTGSASTGSVSDDASASALPTPEDNAKNLAQELSTDKSRPSLKRNSGSQQSSSSAADRQMTPITTHNGSQQTGDQSQPVGVQVHLRIAVSDASPQDIHSYHFQLSADDEAKYRKLLTGMALKALAAAPGVSNPTPTPTPARRKTAHASTAKKKAAPVVVQPELQDVHMDAFDLAYTNNPVTVFSAAAKAPDSTLVRYVTVVTRTETTGETEEIFQSVTANDRLDVTPRMLLVDAVDAYGSGRGDLLFRQISDTGTTFAFYRAEHSNLVKIFEGGDLPLLTAN